MLLAIDEDGLGQAERLQRIAGPDHDIGGGSGAKFSELAGHAEDAGRVDRQGRDRRLIWQAVRDGVTGVVAGLSCTVDRALVALDGNDHPGRIQSGGILHPRGARLQIAGQVGDGVQQNQHASGRDLVGDQPGFLGPVQDDFHALLAGQAQDLLDIGGAAHRDDQRHVAIGDRDQGFQIGA